MSGMLAPYGRVQYFDSNGVPLAGGKLYTYAAGTTTPLAAYQNAALTVAHANPIVLDSAGRATIFLSPVSYKFDLKTSSDAAVWTVDGIAGLDALAVGTVLTKVADYTLTVNDGPDVLVLVDPSGGAFTLQLYTAAGNTGKRVLVKKFGSATAAVTIDPNGSQTIDGSATWALLGTNAWIWMESDGTNWRVIGRGGLNINAKTATYTVVFSDDIICVTSGTFTVTLPTAVGCRGSKFTIKNMGTGVVTVDGDGSETIDGIASQQLTQWDSMDVVSDGANWFIT